MKNILIERWCSLQQKLLLFIKKAGYTIINGDCILDEIFKKKIKLFLDSRELQFQYSDIELIEPQEAENTKNKM